MIKYAIYESELISMLDEDQSALRVFSARFYQKEHDQKYTTALNQLKVRQKHRTLRMLTILDEIGVPSLANTGARAAQAVSILALHYSKSVLREICTQFQNLYTDSPSSVYKQAIPSMLDRLRIIDRPPQQFGTQWEFDATGYPFITPIEDFGHVDEQRAAFGIEPFRWPRSLILPKSEQPWLRRPLSEAVMRELTDEEYETNYRHYLE